MEICASLIAMSASAKHLVREARSRAGLTQSQLAERLGAHQSSIARYESGDVRPDLETLERICAVAGFRLRIEIVPADHAQTALIEDFGALSPAARLRSATRHARLAAKAARAR